MATTGDRPALVLLFGGPLPLDAARLAANLRRFHPDLESAGAAGGPPPDAPGEWAGRAAWGRHEVTLAGVDAPPPPELLEACVDPAHYPPPLKARARAARSHLVLGYTGSDPDPIEGYTAVAAVAAVAGLDGGTTVLNEPAHTSVPYEVVLAGPDEGDTLELLRRMPVPMLYGGFVKLEIERLPGVWMRTRGHRVLGLPDFALHAAGHHEGDLVFDVFTYLADYLRDGTQRLLPGDTLAVGPDLTYRVRTPNDLESFLASDGEMLVLERVVDAAAAGG